MKEEELPEYLRNVLKSLGSGSATKTVILLTRCVMRIV